MIANAFCNFLRQVEYPENCAPGTTSVPSAARASTPISPWNAPTRLASTARTAARRWSGWTSSQRSRPLPEALRALPRMSTPGTVQTSAAAYERFLNRHPAYATTGRSTLRAGVRPPRRDRPDLSRLHRRQPARGEPGARARAVARRAGARQSALGEPDLGGDDGPRRAGPRGGAGVLQRRRRLHRDLHAQCPGALKLVGESCLFAPGGRLLLSTDNHNSVNGIREFALARGAAVDYAPLTRPALRLDLQALDARLTPVARQAPACSRFRRSPTSPASSIR